MSMQLSRISPAPSASTARASSTASMSRPSRPPRTVHCAKNRLHHMHDMVHKCCLPPDHASLAARASGCKRWHLGSGIQVISSLGYDA